MARYIDADKIPFYEMLINGANGMQIALKSDIDKIPTADVRPERYGEWVERSDGGEGYVCDNCNGGYTLYDETPYCPNCGAKMDGGEGNGKIR